MTYEIRYDAGRKLFGILGVSDPEVRRKLEFEHGFDPLDDTGASPMTTPSPAICVPFFDWCDEAARRIVWPFKVNYDNSFALAPLRSVASGENVISAPPAWIAREADPYAFQVAGVQFAQMRRNVLIADEPGAGKTLQSISIFNDPRFYPTEAGAPAIKPSKLLRVAVVCPTFLMDDWSTEISRWFCGAPLPITVLNKPKRDIPEKGFIVVPFSRVADYRESLVASGRFDGVILDEVRMAKSDAAVKRAVAVFGDRLTNTPGVVDMADRTICLDGTPMPKTPVEMHNMMLRLAPEVAGWRSRAEFTNRYCDVDNFGNAIGGKRASALNAELRGWGFMIRREKSAFLPQLPPKHISLVEMPIGADVAELVARETTLYEIAAMKAYRTALELAELTGHIMRVRHELAILKAPRVAQYVQYRLSRSERHRIINFMLHRDAIDIIASLLESWGTRVFVFRGGVPLRKRTMMKKAFQHRDGIPTAIVAQMKAANVGLTLTASRIATFGEMSWSFADNLQAMDRIHRISQTDSVEIDILSYPHAVESRVMKSAANSELLARNVLDARLDASILAAENALDEDYSDDDED